MRTRCRARGWRLDTIVLSTDRIHILLRSPARLSRQAVIRTLQRVTRAALCRAGLVQRWDRRLWDDWAWCRVLTSPTSVTAVRRWLAGRRAAQVGGWDWRWETGGIGDWHGGTRELEIARNIQRVPRHPRHKGAWKVVGGEW